jgi:putative DNA primase/helicase
MSEEAGRSALALIEAGHAIYQRGGALVRPVVDDVVGAHGKPTNIARLVVVEGDYLTDCLCRSATFEKFDRRMDGMRRINPPPHLARTIISRQGEWPFRRVVGVVTTPTLRPDGSVLVEAGYDAATRLLLVEPPEMPELPPEPTRDDALQSLARLLALLTEFPFVSDASRSVGLSALITPVVRAAFTVAPMHVMRAPTPGSGKSFLLDVAAAIAIGRPMPVMAAGRTEEETEKRLGAALLSGQPLISIDNVNGDLGGDALNQIVERPVVDIRVLGKSERVSVEARSTLFATGNNIRLVGDMTRRVIVATLDANIERPESRQFAGNPVKAVLADRGRYVADALIVCRAYIVAGRPSPASPLGSFEGWSDLVRSALMWLGAGDPVETMASARENDPVNLSLRAVFGSLKDAVGLGRQLSSADLIALATEKTTRTGGEGDYRDNVEQEWSHPDLREALLLVAGKGGFIDSRALGNWFAKYRGRIAQGVRLDGSTEGRVAKWWVEPAVSAV